MKQTHCEGEANGLLKTNLKRERGAMVARNLREQGPSLTLGVGAAPLAKNVSPVVA